MLLPLVFLGHGVARQRVAAAVAFDSNTDHRLGCRAGRTQDGNRGQSLIIKLGHKERFLGSNLLPDLPDPYLVVHNRHSMRLVRTPTSVNRLPYLIFQGGLENLFEPILI